MVCLPTPRNISSGNRKAQMSCFETIETVALFPYEAVNAFYGLDLDLGFIGGVEVKMML